MTYRFFLVLMEMHQADPETVELFLDDPQFREDMDGLIRVLKPVLAEAVKAVGQADPNKLV